MPIALIVPLDVIVPPLIVPFVAVMFPFVVVMFPFVVVMLPATLIAPVDDIVPVNAGLFLEAFDFTSIWTLFSFETRLYVDIFIY